MSSSVEKLVHGVNSATVIVMADIGHFHEAEHQLSQLALSITIVNFKMLVQLAALHAGVDTGHFACGLAVEQSNANIGFIELLVLHSGFPHFLYVPFGQVYYLTDGLISQPHS